MKRLIKASSASHRLPITELTEDEIIGLPNRFLVVTRTPGLSFYNPVFRIVNKADLEDPDEICFIDSHWGYARGREVYLATKSEVENYFDEQIDQLQNEKSKLLKVAF